MLSRKGLLPEAAFYFPIPYEPLSICTAEAIDRLLDEPNQHLLDDAYALFKKEMAAADRAYAQQVGLDRLDMEDFCDRYLRSVWPPTRPCGPNAIWLRRRRITRHVTPSPGAMRSYGCS